MRIAIYLPGYCAAAIPYSLRYLARKSIFYSWSEHNISSLWIRLMIHPRYNPQLVQKFFCNEAQYPHTIPQSISLSVLIIVPRRIVFCSMEQDKHRRRRQSQPFFPRLLLCAEWCRKLDAKKNRISPLTPNSICEFLLPQYLRHVSPSP